jgi:hypothetical protein
MDGIGYHILLVCPSNGDDCLPEGFACRRSHEVHETEDCYWFPGISVESIAFGQVQVLERSTFVFPGSTANGLCLIEYLTSYEEFIVDVAINGESAWVGVVESGQEAASIGEDS